MKDSIQERLSSLVDRFEEIGHLLSDPVVIADQNRFRDLSKEYARLDKIAKDFNDYRKVVADIDDDQIQLNQLESLVNEYLRRASRPPLASSGAVNVDTISFRGDTLLEVEQLGAGVQDRIG